MNITKDVGVELCTKDLERFQSKAERLVELVKEAKSLAEDLASQEVNILLDIDS